MKNDVSDLFATCCRCIAALVAALLLMLLLLESDTRAAELLAGTGKVDITNRDAGPVNDPLFAKALVLKSDSTTVVLVSIDAVAIGEIGSIKNDYLSSVRSKLQSELSIPPASVLINASHCHGIVRSDIAECTCEAVRIAMARLVPVKVGAGLGYEDRIMENRRLKLKSGRVADVRHAYSLPPDEQVAEIGKVDPQIGVLRLDRLDGQTLAVVYNFACHPIQGVPSGHNTADIVGFASKVIEQNCSEGTLALFLQGCGGDINPIMYKDVDQPRNAEPLGNMLGLSTLQAVRKIECRMDSRLNSETEILALPKVDQTERIFAMEAEQKRLLSTLQGTSLNLKTFIPLNAKYNASKEFPSYYSHRYLHEEAIGRDDLRKMDTINLANLKKYIQNIHTMEELTRIQTNLELLRKHHANLVKSGKRTVEVEVTSVRVGDWVLVTFPGELTVEIGLAIKSASPHANTFVAGYTNGYIYYAPTREQLLNPGSAQEDCDCILAPEWHEQFEMKVRQLLKKLQ
jgi:hypothetical protein